VTKLGFRRSDISVPKLGFRRSSNNIPKLGFRRGCNSIPKLGFRKSDNNVPKLGFRRGCNDVPKLGFHSGLGFATTQTCNSRQVCTVGGATCSGVGRDRSGGVSRRSADGLLVVGSCPGSAAKCASATTYHVLRRTGAGACGERDDTEVQCDGSHGRRRVTLAFFCWCNSDGAVLGAGGGCFSLQHEVKTIQLLSTLIK